MSDPKRGGTRLIPLRGSHSRPARFFDLTQMRRQEEEEEKEKPKTSPVRLMPPVPPVSFESWIIGLLSGGRDSWHKPYIESIFFDQARNTVLTRTGLDLQYLARFLTAKQIAAQWLPRLSSLLSYRTTSSLTITKANSPQFCQKVLRYLAAQNKGVPRRKYHGEHTTMYVDYFSDTSLYEVTNQFFWFEGSLCYAKVRGTFEASRDPKKSDAQITLYCLGHSDAPLRAFLSKVSMAKEHLQVFRSVAGGFVSRSRPKRALETIDLDPKLMADIKADIEKYFHPDTQSYYKAAGCPRRRGFLFYGPPGTGKTSISAAIASHVDVPLYIINVGAADMNDSILEGIFFEIAEKSVVLFEDIDSAGIVRAGIVREGGDIVPPMPGPSMAPMPPMSRGILVDILDHEGDDPFFNPDPVGFGFGMPPLVSGGFPPLRTERNSLRMAQHRNVANGNEGKGGVTLSGLLNVMDGANALEGRLLIMTSNAPESLDIALRRPGRIDKNIYLGYSTETTAYLMFKRMYGEDPDPENQFKPAVLEKYAKAFAAQIPPDTFTPAELSNFIIERRGNPRKAVTDFATFVKNRLEGNDGFKYDMHSKRPKGKGKAPVNDATPVDLDLGIGEDDSNDKIDPFEPNVHSSQGTAVESSSSTAASKSSRRSSIWDLMPSWSAQSFSFANLLDEQPDVESFLDSESASELETLLEVDAEPQWEPLPPLASLPELELGSTNLAGDVLDSLK